MYKCKLSVSFPNISSILDQCLHVDLTAEEKSTRKSKQKSEETNLQLVRWYSHCSSVIRLAGCCLFVMWLWTFWCLSAAVHVLRPVCLLAWVVAVTCVPTTVENGFLSTVCTLQMYHQTLSIYRFIWQVRQSHTDKHSYTHTHIIGKSDLSSELAFVISKSTRSIETAWISNFWQTFHFQTHKKMAYSWCSNR